MKNTILKIITFITFAFSISACSQNVGSGTWENVLKDTNGSTITTTLQIAENFDNFSGKMITKVDGQESDALKLPSKDLDFSGYVSGKILVIEHVNNTNDPYFKKSTFTVSDDGNSLTLSPSGLIFNKK